MGEVPTWPNYASLNTRFSYKQPHRKPLHTHDLFFARYPWRMQNLLRGQIRITFLPSVSLRQVFVMLDLFSIWLFPLQVIVSAKIVYIDCFLQVDEEYNARCAAKPGCGQMQASSCSILSLSTSLTVIRTTLSMAWIAWTKPAKASVLSMPMPN